MGSLPILTVLEDSEVSPPPATVSNRSLPLTFFDFLWLTSPPVNTVFFYNLPITKTEFTETIVPKLKNSLSITLQHFFPFVGNLILYPSPDKKPEIRYVEGDSVKVKFAECNLDFNDLTGNHPRDCDKFYHLIPVLKRTDKVSDFITIPVFSVQVTLFPNHGFSIGMTNHHCLGDASTRFCFLKAWTSIAESGTDELFLTNGTLPVYDRLVKYPKLDENYLKYAKVETFINEEYQPPYLSGPSNKVRATFILTRSNLNRLKKLVSNQLPDIAYVSSFTVACGYVWSCIAESRKDELEVFGFTIDCRGRMDPPIPAYFGNCVMFCYAPATPTLLAGKEGFVNSAKLLGDSLHKVLTDKEGVVRDLGSFEDLFDKLKPTSWIGVAGTPKLKFYDLDFGWGKPKKHETISIDYNGSISMSACRYQNEDLEIGVCLSATEMEAFVRIFNDGLETFWQDAENRTLLSNLLIKNSSQRPKVLTVEDKLMVLGCKDLERRIVETEMEITLAKSQGFLNNNQLKSISSKRLLAVIGIYTGFGSKLRRNSFIGSYMSKGDSLKKLEERGIVIRFVIGRSPNRGDSLDRNIDEENRTTNDFLILDAHEEADEESAKKTKFFFSTAVQNWDAEFYVKVDNNINLDLEGLIDLLESRQGQNSLYNGCMKSGEVVSEAGKPWYEPDWWKFGDQKSYFRHETGSLFILSRNFAQYININRLVISVNWFLYQLLKM